MARGLTLTNASILGLFFIQRYRFLTIEQFARASGLKRSSASDQLKIVSFPQRPDNEVNASYNKVLVTINNHVLKGGTGTAGI